MLLFSRKYRYIFIYLLKLFTIKVIMMVIEVNINDEIVKQFGAEALKHFLEKEIELITMQKLAVETSKAIKESNIDWDEKIEEGRQNAWEKYKQMNKELFE